MPTNEDVSTIRGTDGDDLFHGGPNTRLVGGTGDDTYYLWDSTAQPTEAAGEGTDTIYANFWGSIVMPEETERLFLGTRGSTYATGNASDNEIHAGPVGATIDGAGGDDTTYGGDGADVFVIRAGEGSDTIHGFTSGFDVVSLVNFGLTSFAQVEASARQDGDDVTIDLGGGQALTLKGIDLTQLTAADFGFSQVDSPAPEGFTKLENAGTTIVENGVYVSNNVWNPGSLVEGRDYAISSTYDPGALTSGTTFSWDFPTTTERYAPVRAYPDIIFGVAPYGDTVNETDTTHTFPVQLSNLDGLSADFATSYSGNLGGFNVSYDIWLTSEPNGGPSTISNEIMIWTHNNAFEPHGVAIGTYAQDGITGTFYHAGTYTALILDQDLPAGVLDLKSVFDTLGTLGIVSQDEWLASVQFGSEVIGGVGSLTIDRFELTMALSDGETRLISGSGTRIVEAAPDPVDAPLPAGMVALYETDGTLTGYREDTQDDAGDPVVNWYDAQRHQTSSDITRTMENGDQYIEHRLADGSLTGLTGHFHGADGSTMTAQYGADRSLLGWSIERTSGSGVETQTFDGTGKLVATKLVDDGAAHYFDATHKAVDATLYALLCAGGEAPAPELARVAVHDDLGLPTGYKTIGTDEIGDPLVTWYGLDGHAQSIDSIKTAENGDVFTEHRDANGIPTGFTGVIHNADGSVTTAHYDATRALLGWDIARTEPDHIEITAYDGGGQPLGRSVETKALGVTTLTSYDAEGGMTGSVVTRTEDSGVAIQNTFDGASNLTSMIYAGTPGADHLTLSSPSNIVHGQGGADTFLAGSGEDTFHFNLTATGAVTTIAGFDPVHDHIALDSTVFTALSAAGPLSEAAFAYGLPAAGAETRLVYDDATGDLLYESHGGHAAGAVVVARLDPHLALHADNILIA